MEHDELARIVPPPDWMVQILKDKPRPLPPIVLDITPGQQDTLRSLIGRNVKIHRGGRKKLELGSANRFLQSITITPKGEKIDPRGTLQHEFGHIADFRNTFPRGEGSLKQATPGGRAYGGYRREEEFARSFNRLFENLQSPPGRNRQDIDDFMEVMEVEPHERDLLVDILNTPIFSEHSLGAEARAENMGRTSPDLPQDALKVGLENLGSLSTSPDSLLVPSVEVPPPKDQEEEGLPFHLRSHHTQGQGRIPPS